MIPGFGGDHFMAPRFAEGRRMAMGSGLIRVLLDPDCGTGHHVFADSATNGPRGAALVEEFIPYIEKTFPGGRRSPRPALDRPFFGRLEQPLAPGNLSGRLWRDLVYQSRPGRFPRLPADRPVFPGRKHVSATARDSGGRSPGWGRSPCSGTTTSRRMDDVIGWGGQLGSFEAVFSPTRSERPSSQALGPVHRRHRP